MASADIERRWSALFGRDPDPLSMRIKQPFLQQSADYAACIAHAHPVDVFADVTANTGGDLLCVWGPAMTRAALHAYEIDEKTASELVLKMSQTDLKVSVHNASAYCVLDDFKDSKETLGVYMDFPWRFDPKNANSKQAATAWDAPATDAKHPEGTVFAFLSEVSRLRAVRWAVAKVPPGTGATAKGLFCAQLRALTRKDIVCKWFDIYGHDGHGGRAIAYTLLYVLVQ